MEKSTSAKAAAAKNRLANTSASSNSARKAAHAGLKETRGIITREMIDKEAKVVAARQKIDRGKTAARGAAIVKRNAKAKPTLAESAKKGIKFMKDVKPKITKAEKGIAKELSPKGVKKAEKMQKGAIDKKYPGMFK